MSGAYKGKERSTPIEHLGISKHKVCCALRGALRALRNCLLSTFIFNGNVYAFLLRPGLAALDNLVDKFVAGWLLPSKVFDLSYPTPFSFCNTKQ